MVEAFVGKDAPMVFVAGSSWPPDEEIFIDYFNAHRDWKLIIAPHVIGEDHLRQILARFNGKAVRYSEATEADVREADCLIIDCFGLLSSIYHYGSVSYVGGGFGVGYSQCVGGRRMGYSRDFRAQQQTFPGGPGPDSDGWRL